MISAKPAYNFISQMIGLALMLLCLLVPAQEIFADTAELDIWSFRNLTTEQHLNVDVVMDIHEDARGFIYLGTTDGLVRYDGLTCKKFHPENGLPGNNYVMNICEHDGYLYFGTHSGVCRLHTGTGRCERLEGLPSEYIRSISTDSHGRVWATFGKGALAFNADEKCRVSLVDSLNADMLIFDRSGKGHFVSKEGDIGNIAPSGVVSIVAPKALEGKNVNAIASFPRGKLMLCTNRGLFMFSSAGLESVPALHGINIKDIAWYNDYTAIIASGVGLFEMNLLTGEVVKYDALDDAPHISVQSVLLDRNSDLWFSTIVGGLYFTQRNCNFVNYHPSRITEFGARVKEMEPWKDGKIFIGTEDAGLYLFDPGDGSIRRMWENDLRICIQGLAMDGNDLWVGQYSSTFRMAKISLSEDAGGRSGGNLPVGKVERIPGISRNNSSVIRTADGRIISGSYSGLHVYDKGTNSFRLLGDMSETVRDVFEDRDGNLWISTFLKGLIVTDRDGNVLNTLFCDQEELNSGIPLKVKQDSRGTIWIMTRGDGIHRYQGGQLQKVQELDFTNVYSMEEDADGMLWISTNRGLVRYDPIVGQQTLYTTVNGLQSNHFNYGSSCRGSDGKLYFGTVDGFTMVDPQVIKTKEMEPRHIVLSSFGFNGDENMGIDIDGRESISLSHRCKEFYIGASLLNYSLPVKQLVCEVDGRRASIHNGILNVPKAHPGSYDIRFYCEDHPEEGRNITVIVRSPWYFSPLSISLYALVLLLGIAFVLRRKEQEIASLKAEIEEIQLSGRDRNFLEELAKCVEENLSNPDFGREELASEMCMSRSSLFTKVKDLTGFSPSEYIKSKRLSRAAELLAQKEHSVTEIAYMTGFSAPSYFSSCFKKQYGVMPREYASK